MNDLLIELMKSQKSKEEFILEQLLKPMKRPPNPEKPVDIGRGKFAVSASQVPALLGCEKRAKFKLTENKIREDSKALQQGCYSDDVILFTLHGIDESVYKDYLQKKYDLLTPTVAENVKKKSLKLAEIIKSGVLGKVRLDLMQKKLVEACLDVVFSGHIDLVTQRGDSFYIWDFKYTSRAAEIAALTYAGQGVIYKYLLSNYLKTENVFFGGIIRTSSIEIDKLVTAKLIADCKTDIDIKEIIAKVHRLRDGNETLSRSEVCAWCDYCESSGNSWHESDIGKIFGDGEKGDGEKLRNSEVFSKSQAPGDKAKEIASAMIGYDFAGINFRK